MIFIKSMLLSIFLFLYLAAYTQFSAGFSAGVSRLQLRGDNPIGFNYGLKPGTGASALFEWKMNPTTSLSIYPTYGLLRAKVALLDSVGDTRDSLETRGHFLMVPLNVYIYSSNKRFYALGGIQPGIFLSVTGKYYDGTTKQLKDHFRKILWSANFGIGFVQPVKKSALFFEIIYIQGLQNIQVSSSENYFPRTKLTTVRLTIGYKFEFGPNNKKQNAS